MGDDWKSYDRIAGAYDEVWGPRFLDAARCLAAQVHESAMARVLDIGTGTAVNAAAIIDRFGPLALIVGCDLSAAMLSRARSRVPALRAVMADAGRLPFTDRSFDLATAGFVLSHLPDGSAALREVFRVLKPTGCVAASSWAPAADPFATAWVELVSTVLPNETVQRATAAVAPSEAEMSDPSRLHGALRATGFVDVRVESHSVEISVTVDQFLADRALSSGGRFARHELGPARWAAFLSQARDEVERRFGPHFVYARGALVATASKPLVA